ncbi:uncharacterized protein [Maniola hyperantus]|uniref:uncharacterized protein n=1 Tax=Aphantopus hyperantus TaxID=2795564 RepID=UPI00374A81D0
MSEESLTPPLDNVKLRKRPKKRKRLRSLSSSSNSSTSSAKEKTASSLLNRLVKNLTQREQQVPMGHGSQHMIPTFDPQAKTQTMKDWLKKINETASVYGWNEKQITFYALPRLVGLAKRWYDGLTTVKYNWKQWQVKLLKAFPCEENYGDLLTEMLVRKSLRNETLEEYYYDKIRLINRCSIVGSKAVDCLTHGIYDNHIRMNVQGLSFKDPENVLNYFRKISSKNGNVMNFRKLLPSIEHPSAQSKDNTIKQKGSTTRCHNCKEIGHFWTSCKKDLVKCNICNRVGHEHQQCFRSKGFRNDKGQGSSQITKNVMQIKTNNSGSSKYYKDVSVNGIATKAFIDFGSECTLISDQLQDPQIKKQLYEMLNSNKQCFAFSNAELGETKETEMQIRLKDDVPKA